MNITLIVCDGLRYDHVTEDYMPNLMPIVDRGSSFSFCLSLGGNTLRSIPYILCSQNTRGLEEQETVIVEENFVRRLKKEGYYTGAIHSNLLLTRRLNFDKIFDFEVDLLSRNVGKSGMAIREFLRKWGIWQKMGGIRSKARASSMAYRRAEHTLEACQGWIDDQADPWFLWAHLMDTHIPYLPENPTERISNGRIEELNEMVLQSLHGEVAIDTRDREDIKWLYGEEVRYMDRWLSRFISNQPPETLIIITSDHGDEFGEYGAYSHSLKTHGPIPQLIHVPLIFIGKDIKSQVVDDYVCHLDVAPTILDFAGGDRKIGHGRSLKPKLITDSAET